MKNNSNFIKRFTSNIFTATFAICTLLVMSCSDDDDPDPINDEEVITTMNVSLSVAGGTTVTLQSQDLDGDGPNAPEITISGSLAANTTYSGTLELLNETETPAENVTEEVAAEDEEHQFFFVTNGAVTDVTYDDEDGDGNPVGIRFSLTTGDAGSGTLQITLRHEPKKPNDGTLADAGGETDITETFSVTIE